jgi:hypothetical protein
VAVALVVSMAVYRDPTREPLTLLRPDNIVEIRSLSGGGRVPTASVLAELAEAPQRPAAGVNWAGARLLRVQLQDDVQLTMQVVPDGGDAWVRVTGDATRSGKGEPLAQAFRRLRTNALHVSGTSALALLGDLRESPLSTNISTITGIGVKQEHDLTPKKNS